MRAPLPAAGRLWLVAIGKAAVPMMHAALHVIGSDGPVLGGGLVVAPTLPPRPLHPLIDALSGDHPLAGPRSAAAAERLGELTARVAADDLLLVLLSGGASALVAAPLPGVPAGGFLALQAALLAAGTDITVTNAVRKRFSRWSAGRLTQAVAPARVRCLAVSDVAGDEPGTIGSGPCTGDRVTTPELLAMLERQDATGVLPPELRRQLDEIVRGERPETPRADDPAFASVEMEVILANRHALRAAGVFALEHGAACEVARDEIAGDAASAGRSVAGLLLARRRDRDGHGGTPLVVLLGGETTVRLDGYPAGRGGRCQELALAAAEVLHAAGAAAEGVVVLAGGTDGRDGPTDAAGAVVDRGTWSRAAAGGVDPGVALEQHDTHTALDAAGDLLRVGLTGTNVRDVVIGVVARQSQHADGDVTAPS